MTRRIQEVFAIAGLFVALAIGDESRAQCPASWVPGVGVPGTNGYVNALAALPGGDVIVGGEFTAGGPVSANYVARYNPGSNTWSAMGPGMNSFVYSLTTLSSGDVIVGGTFTTAGPVLASRVARYNATAGTWSALGSGVNGPVYAVAELASGDLIVGGEFSSAGGVSGRSNIARFNPVSGTWSAMGAGVSGGIITPSVRSLAVLVSGDVVVGGTFAIAGGVSGRNCVARYTPATNSWTSMGVGVSASGFNPYVYSLAVLPGGDVIVGGGFSSAGGATANRIARYNPTTNSWAAMGAGLDSNVYALAVLPGGDLIAGGDFTMAGGGLASTVARYNPSTGAWSALGAGTNLTVQSLTAIRGSGSGDVMVGGFFTRAGGVTATNIARVRPGGPAPAISNQPHDASTCPAGMATFTLTATTSGSPSFHWQHESPPGSGAWSTLVNGLMGGLGTVSGATTASLTITNILPGAAGRYRGLVSDACGNATSNPAMLKICAADFDCDGSADFFDYDQFVICFEGGPCPPGKNADFDGDGSADFFDYDAFVMTFEMPC